jgi:arsenite-transporting ATPase
MRTILTDDKKSAFFFVTLLESLPIAVIRRFIGWFEDFGIPIGGVIVNQAIDKSEIVEDTSEFILNRVKMQDRYREEVNQSFENLCGEIPLFEKEVRGTEMIGRVTDALFPAA